MNFFSKPVIKFNKLFTKVIIPSKAHTGVFQDAAYDLFMFISTSDLDTTCDSEPDITLLPGERRLIPTGLRSILPSGYWVKFHERSGLASKGVHVMGGVIDSAYTGEWKVILYNSNTESITISKDKAIAQFTLERVTDSSIISIDSKEFDEQSKNKERGTKGFGSTDEKKKN